MRYEEPEESESDWSDTKYDEEGLFDSLSDDNDDEFGLFSATSSIDFEFSNIILQNIVNASRKMK